ncbi:GNAT family acetyltransferase [Liquorilactobacillus vini DSM 20605]|uniref:GNAT family acetyltransferase n=1 Tax=Liquorilactobacillus vini DSM 20605 TaxID=1133569 RepID=A0A0R2CBU4_9LACO|nr:GNAT family acetyltransferase [Liquorilactobacillus vini DSM 20605]
MSFILLIRSAKKDDAIQIVPLFTIILNEMELPSLKTIPAAKLTYVIEKSFASPQYRGTPAQTLVAEINGKIAGFAWGYPDENEHQVDEVMRSFFPEVGLPASTQIFDDDEAFSAEWYLDSIAVSPEFQGQGIGTALLKELPQIAKNLGKTRIGLNVDWANPKANKLYHKLGFIKNGTTKLSQHKYDHLILKLN